jgi:hypothetical protein
MQTKFACLIKFVSLELVTFFKFYELSYSKKFQWKNKDEMVIMQTSYDLMSRPNIDDINKQIKSILDTMIQLIQTVKSLNLLTDGTISEEKINYLRNFLDTRLNNEISELQENTEQKNQCSRENNNSNLTTSQLNELIQNRLDTIIKLVKAITLLSDKNIFFDQKELLNTLLQKELNNEISELQKLQEGKLSLVN